MPTRDTRAIPADIGRTRDGADETGRGKANKIDENWSTTGEDETGEGPKKIKKFDDAKRIIKNGREKAGISTFCLLARLASVRPAGLAGCLADTWLFFFQQAH